MFNCIWPTGFIIEGICNALDLSSVIFFPLPSVTFMVWGPLMNTLKLGQTECPVNVAKLKDHTEYN